VPLLGIGRPGVAVQYGLDPLEDVGRDQRSVRTLVAFAEPDELAVVDGVLQHAMQFGFGHRAIAARAPESNRVGLLAECQHGVLAARVQLEDALHERATYRINLNPVGLAVVKVSDGCHARPVALLSLLSESLSDPLAQVVDVLLGQPSRGHSVRTTDDIRPPR
jgi:hypothetical protein